MFVSIFLWLLLNLSSAAVITTEPPTSVEVPISGTKTWSCEGIGNRLNWQIQSGEENPTEITPAIQQQRGITFTDPGGGPGNLSSVLTITGLPVNDGLIITCQVLSWPPPKQISSGTTLTVIGVSSVEDLHHNFTSNNSLQITWSPPVYQFPVGSSVSYQVLVIEEDGDIILDTITPNTNITVPNVTECDTFNFTVTALVDQYTSVDNAVCTNSGSYSVNVTEDLLHHTVFIEVSSMPLSYCEKKLFVKDESDGSVLVDDKTLTSYADNNQSVPLDPFKKYQLSTKVKNLRDKVKDTKHTNISTYNVQDLLVSTYTNGSVSVQCVFVSGSTADGCLVTFTHTASGRNESFTIIGLDNSALISLSASGVYNVTAYDMDTVNEYEPAVYYPTLVEIVNVLLPASASFIIMSESTTPPTQSTISITVSPTVIVTPGIGTTSSTRENDTNNIVHVVAGTVSGSVLVILIILVVCVGIIVYKRKIMKLQVLIRSDIATIQQPQAETNPYQDVQELKNEVPIATSPVLLMSNRSIDEENPYHVTRSEFLCDNHHTIPSHNVESQLMPQSRLPHSSQTSTTTQETILGYSISSSTSLNDIHDNAYTTDPNATDTITVTVNDTATATANNEATNNTADVPTYASIAKRTDTTAIPAVDQHVTYDKVTGDINKRGCINVYSSDNISAISPPPSYADTIAQECGECVAVVHGQYEKHPPTYTGDEHSSKTPVQDQTNSTDGSINVNVK